MEDFRILCVIDFNSIWFPLSFDSINYQGFLALVSYFLKKFLIICSNAAYLGLNSVRLILLVLWLNVNCFYLQKKLSLIESTLGTLTVLWVQELNSIVQAQNLVAIKSYVFCCLKNYQINCFVEVNFCPPDSWFY